MFKGNWHLLAIAATISAIAIKTNHFIIFFIALLLLLIFLYMFNRINIFLFITSLFTFFFFYQYFPSYDEFSHSLPSHFFKNNVNISGTIVSEVNQTDERLSFTLLDHKTNIKIQITHFYDKNSNHIFPYTYDAICHVIGEIRLPDEPTNPFEFNFRQYLFEKGIFAEMIVDSMEQINCKQQYSLLQQIYMIRESILLKSNQTIHPKIAAWQQALIFGNSSLIDEQVTKLFQRWGLSHLLAISGLHVGIIIAIIYFILIRLFQVTKEKAQLFVLMFLPLYALLAGGQPSVWRATLMTIIVIVMSIKNTRMTNTDVLSVVFLSLILLNKFIIYQVGFQFSFAVTFGLLLSTKWFKQSKNNFEIGLKISFIAQMMIVPLQMYYFFHFQPLSILLNVIIVPYFSLFVIPFMFLSLFLFFLPNTVVSLIEVIFISIHEMVIKAIFLLDRYVNTPFLSGEITLEIACIYYLCLFLMMIYLEMRNLRKSFQYGVFVTVTLTYVIVQPYISKEVTVTMLDIGQGDTFIIELPYRRGVFIIDAAATFNFDTFEPSETVFNRVIRPYLLGRGINTIDAIFVTHADLDHHGSVRFIVDQFNVKEIIVHPYFNNDDKEFQYWLHNEKSITKAKFLEKIERNGQIFYVLSPKRNKNEENNNSLVLYTKIGDKYWLFTGDISKEEEREITNEFPFLQVDILKVSHHGSQTSTDEKLLKTYQPEFAFISVGRRNRYGHPATEVIDILNKYNVIVVRTDEYGAVQYKYDGKRSSFIPFINQ